jgi:hypothetical protein
MNIPIFLSYPRPHTEQQEAFLTIFRDYLIARGLQPRTLGVTDYDADAPLKAIRRLMLESCGLVCVAFQRTRITTGVVRPGANLSDSKEMAIQDQFITSPYCQIEPAMAYQLGLPILLFRQKGVIADGVFEKGVVGLYMPEFSVIPSNAKSYLESPECREVIHKWEGQVRKVVDTKGNPPLLY